MNFPKIKRVNFEADGGGIVGSSAALALRHIGLQVVLQAHRTLNKFGSYRQDTEGADRLTTGHATWGF